MRWIRQANERQRKKQEGTYSAEYDSQDTFDYVWRAPLGEGFGDT